MDDATVFTVPHDLHRLRRAPLASFFSRSVVSQSQDLIRNKVEKLCSRITEFQGTKQPIDLSLAFRCLTTDVVTQYALSKSYGLLDTPNFSPAWFKAVLESGEFALVGKHFPWLVSYWSRTISALFLQNSELQDRLRHSRKRLTTHIQYQRRRADLEIIKISLMQGLPSWFVMRLNPEMGRFVAKSEV